MKFLIKILIVTTCGLIMLGCSEEGPAEKAGKKIDSSYEKVKSKVQNKGDFEKAGEKVDEALGS